MFSLEGSTGSPGDTDGVRVYSDSIGSVAFLKSLDAGDAAVFIADEYEPSELLVDPPLEKEQ